MSRARRELLHQYVDSGDHPPASTAISNIFRRGKNAKSSKKFADGLVGLEEIARLYENCPEFTMARRITRRYNSKALGSPGKARLSPSSTK